MKNNKKITAVACTLASLMALGTFAGCANLKTTDALKDMEQVIAEVDITKSARFEEDFAGYAEAISTASVSKREMIASFIGSGYSAMNSYGWTYADTFQAICDSLVDRQIYIQYAIVHFLKNGWTDEDGVAVTYSLGDYNAAIAAAEAQAKNEGKSGSALQVAKDVAGIGYFLTEKERNLADYTLKVSFNQTLDTQEEAIIVEEEDETEYESSVRTLPTGINTKDEDFYDIAYNIYTGTGKQSDPNACGTYETLDGSTPTTRTRAYNKFLANLRTNDLIEKGEDTSDITKLNYYQLELKSAYEGALITKLNDTYTEESNATVTRDVCESSFNDTLATQIRTYKNDSSALESDLDAISDTKFVLTTTGKEDRNYGFVINILLPFSTRQSQILSEAEQGYQDGKGNKFETRASLLSQVKATDQRGSWFTGETDYSFDASEKADAYTGGNGTRKWLFFEDSLKAAEGEETLQYQTLKNYCGNYTYNGIYDADKRVYVPNKIDVDGFLTEMRGYLNATLGSGALSVPVLDRNYYSPVDGYYNADGTVNYETFVYTSGKIDWSAVAGAGESSAFDANRIFVKGSKENKALSVINELSFAYNTDTAGLNTYLGYAVTANKTSFVSEFEYAAQWAVKNGAGSYCVVPSDYGWHIIYCTFSFADTPADKDTPFTFDYSDIETEGSFSYLYYEALKSNALTNYSTNRRSKIINAYLDSSTVYEERYADLSGLDSAT